MPRYIVEQVREYTERWLVEACSEGEAEHSQTILDHDDGSGGDTGQSITVYEVDDDQEEL